MSTNNLNTNFNFFKLQLFQSELFETFFLNFMNVVGTFCAACTASGYPRYALKLILFPGVFLYLFAFSFPTCLELRFVVYAVVCNVQLYLFVLLTLSKFRYGI